MTEYKFTDRANIGTVKRTKEGYLVTQARALRTGVQDYMAYELGLDGDGMVRVMRPEDSVRNPESLTSLSHAPITIGHPQDDVTSETWKDLSVGEVSTGAQWDGDFISLPLILKDKAAIEAVEAGMSELSAGYTADMMPSDSPDYDYVMGPPVYNHIAIVDKARAGSEARIGDNAAKPWGAAPLTQTEKEPKMADMKTVVVGDQAVQVAAADADVITKMMKDHQTEVDGLKEELATVKIEAADAAKKVKTDEEISAMVADGVKELGEVAEKARKMVADYDATDKDAMTIRREVIAKVYGDEAVADLESDSEIKAAFKVADSQVKVDPVRTAAKDAKPQKPGSAWDGLIKKKDDK